MKKINCWLKLKGYDLLQRNVCSCRNGGENYIEDVQTNALTRFFMLSVNHRFNYFGGKKK
ncbi:MAG: hypothetical protein V4722_19290 [Bacteroidota bacterium]